MGDKFDEILAKSQRLTTQLGLDSDTAIFTQPLRRGINDLETSKNIGLGGKQYFEEQDKLNAVRLLAQKNFDAVKLSSEVHGISVEIPYYPTERLEGIDLDGYLAHHHDMIVLNAIDDTTRLTEDYVKQTQRKRLVKEWQTSRKNYIESLGNVTQHWNTKAASSSDVLRIQNTPSVAVSTNVTTSYTQPTYPALHSSSQTPGKTPYGLRKTLLHPHATPLAMENIHSRQSSTARTTINEQIDSNTVTASQQQNLSELIQRHAAVIHQLHTNLKLVSSSVTAAGGSYTSLQRSSVRVSPCTELAETVSIPLSLTSSSASSSSLTSSASVSSTSSLVTDDNGLTRVDLAGYQASLEVLGEMVGESLFALVTPGLFSPICFSSYIHSSAISRDGDDTGTGTGTGTGGNQALTQNIHEKKQFLSLGALSFLERQQLRSLTIDIDDNIQKGYVDPLAFSYGSGSGSEMRGGESRRRRVKAFVYHLFRTGGLYSASVDPHSLAMTGDNLWSTASSGGSAAAGGGGGGGLVSGGMGGGSSHHQHQQKLFPVWPYVYYCLISGDLNMAIDELKYCVEQGVRHVEVEIMIVLQYFQYFLSKYKNINNGSSGNGSGNDSSCFMLDDSAFPALFKGERAASTQILSTEQTKEFYQALDTCKQLYEQEADQLPASSTAPAGVSRDPYRTLILNLVSLSDKTALSDPGLAQLSYSLQNYLWANVWFIVFERYALAAVNGPRALIAAGHDKPVELGENWLYSAVLDYGGDEHFDPSGNNPLKYISVLLVCQRFGDAILHLWHTSKTLPAVHLTVLALHYGLILPHVPLTQNPVFSHASQQQQGARSGSRESGSGSGSGFDQLTPSSLLTYFFNAYFQNLYPELSVDYFLCLNSNWLPSIQQQTASSSVSISNSNSNISSSTRVMMPSPSWSSSSNMTALIDSHVLRSKGMISSIFESFLMNLRTESSLSRVVGAAPVASPALSQSQSSFSRGGYLHEYMSTDMINLLLVRCAYHMLNVNHDPVSAIRFYKLADRMTDALDELCHQLSTSLSASISLVCSGAENLETSSAASAQREFWLNESVAFYEAYVSSGVGPLVECLQRDDRGDLVKVFLQLLNISSFMQAYTSANYSDAYTLLTGELAALVPTQPGQVKACCLPIVSKNISAYIQVILDDLILVAVDCLIKLFCMYSEESQSVMLTAIQQNERRLNMGMMKGHITCVVSFTSEVSLCLNRSDTHRVVTALAQQLHSQYNGNGNSNGTNSTRTLFIQ